MTRAFSHLKVLDLCSRLSGAWAARLFGDFGAEVVLLESDEGHKLRDEAPVTKSGESLMHTYVNWNKYSVKDSEISGTSLVSAADVVITTDTNLSDEILNSMSEETVHLSITPQGLTGPWSEKPGNNLTACANVSWSAISACEGEPPLQLPHNQTGYISGVAGFVSACAALFNRERTGQGERCDVSEMEVMATTCAPWAEVGLFVGGNRMAHGPHGARTKEGPGPLWQCNNGPINLGFAGWRKWTQAFEFLNRPDVANDPDLIPGRGRRAKALAPVRAILGEALDSRDKWEIFHGLAEHHCISGVVQNAKELTEDQHLNAREFLIDIKVEDLVCKSAGPFAQLSATPWSQERPAPKLGEHTQQIKEHELFTNSKEEKRRPRTVSKGQLPLHGIRVLTFTQAWSGTHATQLLALLGADVVQIESLKRPDVWRGEGTPVPPAVRNPDIEQHPLNTNGLYNSVNLNKRAITLDMSRPEGLKIFWELIPQFDIFCENFSPHVMHNWGVTYESLQQRRGDIIFGSLSGYGQTGPIAEYPANGDTTEPMAGISAMHGYINGPAQNTGGLIPDPISGYYFASAILVALLHRQRTGIGQRIDLSMIESVAVQCGDAILEYEANGHIRGPGGNSHPTIAPHNVYETEDGRWIALAAESDEAFQDLLGAMNSDKGRFMTKVLRKEHEQEVDLLVEKWIAEQSTDSICEILQGSKVTFAVVQGPDEVYREPNEQFADRGFLRAVTHPESGTHFMPLLPWLYSHSARGEVHHSPCLGQHSFEVFQQELGMTLDEYESLEAKGITGTTSSLKSLG